MTTFTIPEEIIGIPLWVPDSADYFDIDPAGMPNGDPCLVVRGDLSTGYKAFMRAPTLSPRNLLIDSDAGSENEWAMSCWLKVSALGSIGEGDVMLGCSTYTATGVWGNTRNLATPLLLGSGPTTVSRFQVFRDPSNNIGSGESAKYSEFNASWEEFEDDWFLFVINSVTALDAGNYMSLVSAWIETRYDLIGSDPSGPGNTAGPPYTQPNFLHIGAYHLGGVGRAGLWRIGKWAFHDRALTQQDREDMWHGMYGTAIVHTDDFNRSDPENYWPAVATGWSIDTNTAYNATGSIFSRKYAKDLGSPYHYAQAVVVNTDGNVFPFVRARGTNYYSGGYAPASGVWRVYRGGTLISSGAGTPPPATPYTTRVEVETISGDVEIRVYADGVLCYSYTDTSVSKLLVGNNAGLALQAGTGPARADNFECGTL